MVLCRDGARATEHGLLPLMQFLVLGSLQKVPDTRQSLEAKSAACVCQRCSLAERSLLAHPFLLHIASAQQRQLGIEPSMWEAPNTHLLKLLYCS